MVSNIEAAKAGATYIPSVWEVAQEFYGRIKPSDPLPDIPIPERWELHHKEMGGNPSGV